VEGKYLNCELIDLNGSVGAKVRAFMGAS
jgi:hypothetical protein